MTTEPTFAERLEVLEQPLTLADLPMRELRAALLENGDPVDLSVFALAGTLGAVKYAAGESTVTFTAAATSAQVTVPHGLNTVPTEIFTFPSFPHNVNVALYESATADTTNIYIAGRETDAGAITNTQTFYWLAII